MKNNNHGGMKAMAVGAGLAAAAAAGIYFLYGAKNAKHYRSKVKSWMFTAKGEILDGLEKIENVSEEQYHNLVDTVSAKYAAMQHIDKDDIARFTGDMKKHWKTIVKTVMPKKARGTKAKK